MQGQPVAKPDQAVCKGQQARHSFFCDAGAKRCSWSLSTSSSSKEGFPLAYCKQKVKGWSHSAWSHAHFNVSVM